MAAALSLLGEINNALSPHPNPQEARLRWKMLLEGLGSLHGAPRAGRLDKETSWWAGSLSLAGLEEQ